MVIILTGRRVSGPSWITSPVLDGGPRFRTILPHFSPTVSTCVLSRVPVMRYTGTYDCPATGCGGHGPGEPAGGLVGWPRVRLEGGGARGARKRDAAKRWGPARRTRK